MPRTNIYSDELTDKVEKVVAKRDGKTYYGVRFYLKSPNELAFKQDDDTRSAVTFWSDDEDILEALFDQARGAAGA